MNSHEIAWIWNYIWNIPIVIDKENIIPSEGKHTVMLYMYISIRWLNSSKLKRARYWIEWEYLCFEKLEKLYFSFQFLLSSRYQNVLCFLLIPDICMQLDKRMKRQIRWYRTTFNTPCQLSLIEWLTNWYVDKFLNKMVEDPAHLCFLIFRATLLLLLLFTLPPLFLLF